jgi:hypothetical protein
MERWAGFMVFGDDVFYVLANTYSVAVKQVHDHAGRVARKGTSSVLCVLRIEPGLLEARPMTA